MSAYTELERVVDVMPAAMCAAMLDGISNQAIIGGRYVSPDGVCPLLAALRAGQPPQHTAPFAAAWDRYLRLKCSLRGRIVEVRPASERELGVLRALLRRRLLGDRPASVAGDRACFGCARPERLDLRGDCAYCGVPLVRAAVGADDREIVPAAV